MRRTRGKGFSSSTCHPESCKLNLPGQLQTIFLPGLRVLASGSADAGARPVCIALTPPPGMAQGGYFAGGLPCRRHTRGGCLFSNRPPEHRVEDGTSHCSRAPPSPVLGSWAVNHHLLGQFVLEQCLPEQVLEQFPGPGRLPGCLCWHKAAQR